mmetsp:Transcript_52007/g.52995  ORF Transcript_52007/g.52995 Transcript_52007/m.52995 type:complete len:82 (+) Transcript_52007:68-313(+)
MIQTLVTKLVKCQLLKPTAAQTRRRFSFSFAGPKKLHEILKKELIQDKTRTEISDLWYTYHENKVTFIRLLPFNDKLVDRI